MYSILLIDDDHDYSDLVSECLSDFGYAVTTAYDESTALRLIRDNKYDLILTDLHLEKMDPITYLDMIRIIDPVTKLIVLSASTNETDELNVLKLNVNDFIRKPVNMDVLDIRIKKLFQVNHVKNDVIRIEEKSEKLLVDVLKRRVFSDGKEIKITEKEFDFLVYLMQNKNRVITRIELENEIWNSASGQTESRIIDTYVLKLRTKLNLDCIYTIRSIGYEWISDEEL